MNIIGIVVSVLLVFVQILPLVNCQHDLDSEDSVLKFSAETVIGVILVSMFLLSMVACCLFYASHSAEIEARGREVFHVRSNNGLDKEVIKSFPCFLYSYVKGLKIGKGGVECAICLNEFKDEEMLRWMPPCSHTFHTNCIDVWLSSRSTCPVCRANLSMKHDESFPFPSIDLESGISQRDDLESICLTEDNGNFRAPRSKSTGVLSSWRMIDIFVPRSYSTGHSLVQLGENLDRFTLQLPEEVQRQLVSLNQIRRNHKALPRAMSSRQGYRSGSFGSQKGGFSQGRRPLRRAISMSFIFSFQTASVRSTTGKNNLVGETSQSKDNYFGERSFQRLMPKKV